MARRCCCFGCIIESDDFNRTDSTNLGSKWSEITGDSEIVGNELSIPTNGKVLCTKRHPFNTPSCLASMTIRQPVEVGDIFRVLVNYKKTPVSYLFGQFEITGANTGTLSVGSSPNTLLHSVNIGHNGLNQDNTLNVCRSLEGIFAGTDFSSYAWACAADPGGRYAGIENFGPNTVHVDNFEFRQHDITFPDCGNCACECEGHCIPKTLSGLLVGSGCCADWNGLPFTFTFQESLLPDFIWTGSVTVPTGVFGSSGCAGDTGFTFHFALQCWGCGTEWKLCSDAVEASICDWITGPGDPCGYWPNGLGWKCATPQCNPIDMMFGPLTCLMSLMKDCVFAIRVTE